MSPPTVAEPAPAHLTLELPSPGAAGTPEPPTAERRPSTRTLHGVTLTDEYAWLRDRHDPAVLAHLEAENAYADAMMAPVAGLREALFRELRARILETDLSVPERDGEWWFYTRTEEGKQYPIHCRKRHSLEAPEEILLDENEVAKGHTFFRLGALEQSPDGRYLAYSVDVSGAEEFELRLLDLATGIHADVRIPRTSYGVAWAADSRHLFYTELDEAERPFRVRRHALGTSPADDATVYEEPDPAFFVSVGRSRSGQLLVIDASSHTSTEARILDADRPLEAPRLVAQRRAGIEYDVAHQGDRLLIVTNDGAPNFRLLSAPLSDPRPERWTPVRQPDPAERLERVDAFASHLVMHFRREGLQGLRIVDARGTEHEVTFPEPAYALRRAGNRDFHATVFRFVYTSLVTPQSVIDYGMDDRRWVERKRQPVLGGYDAAQYRTERRFAVSPDGTRVPVSLVYRLPRPDAGARPAYLVGYGAYGASSDPGFSTTWISLLDRGFTVAIAHVRGGEELGRAWYEAGKLANKPNTFADFEAVAELLVADGFTTPGQLAINGGSAGGLLIGAVCNRRPELFGAAIAEVPFVDVLNTMLDPTLPLTVIEYDEWGNPGEPAAFHTIHGYSPYENVRSQAYPAIYATAGLNDPRVGFWEAAKWVARLRERKTDDRPLLLRVHMGAGHSGASGRYDYLREVADKFAFVLWALRRPEA